MIRSITACRDLKSATVTLAKTSHRKSSAIHDPASIVRVLQCRRSIPEINWYERFQNKQRMKRSHLYGHVVAKTPH